MSEIKVGDWVIFDNGNIKAIKKVSEIMLDTYNDLLNKYTTLWQPKEGEWVVISFGNENAVITKFDKNANYVDIEPFIGELPSFLKDTK
jgi:hydrogenase maturation factor